MFWIFAAGLTAIVAYAILSPVWRARGRAEPAAAFDLRVYRDQLREVERDLDRGVIRADDADRLRVEIGRKVLDADRRLTQAAPTAAAGRPIVAGVVMAGLLAIAATLYLSEGVPGASDMPLQARLVAADAAYRDRPSQAEAEAAVPPRPQPDLSAVDPEYLDMVEQLRQAVARTPDDPQGLQLLSTHEMRLGNLPAARAAQERLVGIEGDNATAAQLMQLATLMIEAAGGVVTPEAESVLSGALAKDPDQPQARYLQGVLLIQNGRPDRAFPIWRRLLEEGPETAPWIPSIRAAIADLAWLAGDADYTPPALPGPDADALAAAEDMPLQDRQQMIEGMVAGLQQRLATEGGSPSEWARLVGALGVLERTEEARAILQEARTRFPQPDAVAPIEEAARAAGLDP
ncbi:c-type cytochrome biogenesis protein CcmI [Paracoccus beibuensis]|uniref:c-type cytochrome biogenesis protein CcmI n=1 Tax=Paracoccus beibuensis TaxID=547602 RepID=UPI00224035BB|nr:c-type cytochrome biogenesis protein CcmI [Paracoccus beibuensis]